MGSLYMRTTASGAEPSRAEQSRTERVTRGDDAPLKSRLPLTQCHSKVKMLMHGKSCALKPTPHGHGGEMNADVRTTEKDRKKE